MDIVDMELCSRCGKCCWDWKGDNPADRCEHLAEDMKTCLIHGRWAEFGYSGCAAPLQPHQAVDLPEECGYMIYWREQGLI